MLLIVVPAGVGAGLGEGFEFGLDEGGVVVLEDPGAEAEELPEPAGPEFDAVAGAGTAIVLWDGAKPVQPHPAITIRIEPAKAVFNAKRGTERISQF